MIFPIQTTKYKILEIVYKEPGIKISDIIKKVKASQASVYKHITALLKSDAIKEEKTGKKPLLRLFYPNFNSEAGKLLFALLEKEKALIFFEQHKELKGPFSQFSKEAEKLADIVLIFGSFARGTETKESDIDMVIIAKRLYKDKMQRLSEECFVTVKNNPAIRLFKYDNFLNLLKNKDGFALQIMASHIIIFSAYNWTKLLSES